MAISKIKGSAIQDATIPEEKLEDEAGSFRMILDASDGSATDAGDFLLLDATASSTNVGEQFLFEPATDDGSATLSKSNHIISSNLVTDELRGLTSINSISVRGEGGLTTTNLQQGLAKTWINLNGNGTIATRDSLNISGIVDGGTGLYDVSVSSNMSNDDYAAKASGSYDNSASSSISGCYSCRSLTTSSLRITCAGTTNNVLDMLTVTMSIHGDLA